MPECWLCEDLGGIAIHYKWTKQRGKTLWTPHRPSSRSHPVYTCPVCGTGEFVEPENA